MRERARRPRRAPGKGYRVKELVRRAHLGRLASLAVATLGLALLLPPLAAHAAADATSVIELQKAPVVAFSCEQCHGNISDTKLPGINFKHAAHIVFDCKACHSIFPHQPEGTSIPKMQECWNCHALRHGPQGQMAEAGCPKCHKETKDGRPVNKPTSHVADWAAKPHVAPANRTLRTQCMMCHTEKFCVDCHDQKQIFWQPKEPFTYDGGNGCLACHGAELPRLKTPVNGVDASAHRLLTCGQCHPDFKYYDGKDATPLWRINAGKACGECHDHTKIDDVYQTSIHGTEIAKGNYRSATCAGCHGGHDIERLKTQAAKNRLQLSASEMCAGCHAAEWVTYDDYWHGKPYKAGALDAPACWDCHGSHDVLKKNDPKSTVSPENVAKTCGGSASSLGSCHEGSQEEFVAGAGTLIHGLDATRRGNPVAGVLDPILGWGK
jgi:hypothetical protein